MKSVLVIGLGNFGMLTVKKIHELGHQVMAIDKNEERVNSALPYVTNALIGDSTNEKFLESLGINNYDVCIETIGNDFQSSLETTCLLKELGGKVVVSRANREVQAKFLLRNGADEIVNPEKQIAKWTAIRYTSDYILDYIKLDDNYAIFEVKIPLEWIGKSIQWASGGGFLSAWAICPSASALARWRRRRGSGCWTRWRFPPRI